jgi:hypothetical protein
VAEHGRDLFSQLTDKAIRRGIFHSVPALIDAIEAYLATHNQRPEPFQWTATADQILDKVRRGRVTLQAIASKNRDAPLVFAVPGAARWWVDELESAESG